MSSDINESQRGIQELRYNVVLDTYPVVGMEDGRLMR